MNGGWNSLNAFSAYIEMIVWFYVFPSNVGITLIDLCTFSHSCVPGINLTLHVVYDAFIYYWIQFANILLRSFMSYTHLRYWHIIFLFF